MLSPLLALTLAAAPSTVAPQHPFFLGPKPKPNVARVVTLAPSLTETVVALGAKDTLVGVTRFDELPEVAKLPRVGGFVDPSVEAVLGLHPDLVLVQPGPGNQPAVEKMAQLGIPVLAVPLHTIEEVVAAIDAIGSALGHLKQAASLRADIEHTRARIREQARPLPHPKVLVVYEFQPLVVAGPGSFPDQLLADAGAVNAAAGATTPYPTWSVESAVASRPQVVIDAAHSRTGEDVLRGLPGLKEARWVRIPTENLMHPGPGLARGLEELFALVHPDAVKR